MLAVSSVLIGVITDTAAAFYFEMNDLVLVCRTELLQILLMVEEGLINSDIIFRKEKNYFNTISIIQLTFKDTTLPLWVT